MNLSARECGGWSNNYSVNKFIFHEAMEKEGMKARSPSNAHGLLSLLQKIKMVGEWGRKAKQKIILAASTGKNVHALFPFPSSPFSVLTMCLLYEDTTSIFFSFSRYSQEKIEFFCTVKTKSSGSRPTENQRPRPVWSVTPMCPISIALKGMQPKRLEGCFHFEGNRLNGG